MLNLKNISKKIKKSVSLVAILFLILACNFSALMGLVFLKNNTKLLASSIEASKISLSNPSFSSSSGSSPKTPTSWTKIENNTDVISGVIDIDDADKGTEKLKLNSDISKYEGMAENHVLLMNSPNSVSKMGYRSSEFTFERNSNYVVSFKAYAENGTYGSAYITSSDLPEGVKNYFNITTPYEYEKEVDDGNGGTTTQVVRTGVWKTCYILVTTNNYFDTKATLDLRLGNSEAGSKGAILFDDIVIQKYSETDFNSFKSLTMGSNQCLSHFIDLKNVSNADFSETFEDNNLLKWEKVKDCDADNEKALNGHTYLGSALNQTATGITDSVSNQGIIYSGNVQNKGALFINNTEKLSVGYKLKNENCFNIEQNSLYLLTFDAFTGTISGDGAKAKIYAKNSENKFELVTTSDNISTDKQWKTYAFAINSNGFKNTEVYVEFWVENSTGYAIFDNVNLNKVGYEYYQDYLTANSSTCKESDVSFIKNTELNGFFNKTYAVDNSNKSILKVQKWTNEKYTESGEKIDESNTVVGVAGVVNTQNWNGLTFENPGNPNSGNHSETSNNILLLQNKDNIKQIMKSASFKIASGKYYEISLDIKTIGDAKAGIKLYNSENKVIFEELAINNSEWKNHTICVVGGTAETTVSVELSLGEDECLTGNAYFDNLIVREITNSNNKASYSEIFENATAKNVVDLTKTNFYNVNTLSKTNGIFDSRDWTYTKQAKVNVGVVDTLNFSEVATEFNVKNPGVPNVQNVNSKVFMIDSAFDGYYTAKGALTTELDLDSYYKVTFYVLTQDIPENKSDLKYNYGASIKVVDSNVKLGETFSGINTFGEWKEYTLYLNTLTNDQAVEKYKLNVTLGLGSEKLQSTGTVYFSEIVTTKIEQAEFDNIVKEQEETVKDNIITFVGSTASSSENSSDSSTDSSTESSDKVSFSFLYFSTILTAVVVLLAVIAFALKSLKIKRPIHIKAVDLSKERMSARNFAFKDKMIEINNRLAVLDDQLFETNKAIDDLAYERLTDSNKLEELKTQKAEIVQKMRDAKQEEHELVEQFKKFKKDERLRKNRSKNK